jgi:hypothetical protein
MAKVKKPRVPKPKMPKTPKGPKVPKIPKVGRKKGGQAMPFPTIGGKKKKKEGELF